MQYEDKTQESDQMQHTMQYGEKKARREAAQHFAFSPHLWANSDIHAKGKPKNFEQDWG